MVAPGGWLRGLHQPMPSSLHQQLQIERTAGATFTVLGADAVELEAQRDLKRARRAQRDEEATARAIRALAAVAGQAETATLVAAAAAGREANDLVDVALAGIGRKDACDLKALKKQFKSLPRAPARQAAAAPTGGRVEPARGEAAGGGGESGGVAPAGATAKRKPTIERITYLPPPGDAFAEAEAELRAAVGE